ncbi:MAG: sugar ABC transporter ATP-binding protein [Solirubrobacteraceae bacterium]
MTSSTVILSAQDVAKRFGGTQAVREASIELRSGEIHGLIGPNGAGKSTLVGMLTGLTSLDRGTIELAGEAISLSSNRDGLRKGIVTVPQELAVPGELSVGQCICLGAEPRRAGFVRRGAERRAAQVILDRLGLDVSVRSAVGALLPSQQKAIMVAQALHREARALLLDEPTAGMSGDHAEPLLEVVSRLREHDIAVLYISHRLAEVVRLCPVVTVMRDGAVVAVMRDDAITRPALAAQLTKGEREPDAEAAAPTVREPAIGEGTSVVVEGLEGVRVSDVSLTARPGEILGLAGLPGSGVEDVFAAIAGVQAPKKGTVRIGGQRVVSSVGAVRAGVGYLPPARRDAVLPDDSVARNMVISSLDTASRRGVISRRREFEAAAPIAEELGLGQVLRKPIRELSGGNQQRALFGRLLLSGSRVLVLEDPTVGVDVNARQALHDLLARFAAEGRTCIVGSGEPEELSLLCDRVLVFRGGSLCGELVGDDVTEHAIVAEMTGARDSQEAGV